MQSTRGAVFPCIVRKKPQVPNTARQAASLPGDISRGTFGGLKSGEDLVGLDGGIIHYQEINVTGSSGGSPWDIARTLELMDAGEIDAGKHISRVGDLDHAVEFLEMVKAQRIDGKAVVYPHRHSDEILAVPSWSAQDERAYLLPVSSSP